MKTITAIYNDGVFCPEEPVDLPAGAHVQVMLPEPQEGKADRLRKRFPNSIGSLSPDEAARIRAAIEETFETVNPDEWE